MKSKVLFLIPLLILITIPNASAHKLIDSDENYSYDTATVIPDITLSRAIYAEIEPNLQNYYAFNGQKDTKFFGEIVIPIKDSPSLLEPKLAIVGDVSSISTIRSQVLSPNAPCDLSHTMGSGCFYDITNSFPYPLPTGKSAIVFENSLDLPTEQFYEPFSMTDYSQRQTISFTIPDESLYYIVVYSDDLFDDNSYTLATGFIEDWSALDLVTLLPYYVIKSQLEIGDYSSLLIILLFVSLIVYLFRKKIKIR